MKRIIPNPPPPDRITTWREFLIWQYLIVKLSIELGVTVWAFGVVTLPFTMWCKATVAAFMGH